MEKDQLDVALSKVNAGFREVFWNSELELMRDKLTSVLLETDEESEALTSWRTGTKMLNYFGQGFHFYTSLERVKKGGGTFQNRNIYECTVPKGSEYYLSGAGAGIANKIIIDKPVK